MKTRKIFAVLLFAAWITALFSTASYAEALPKKGTDALKGNDAGAAVQQVEGSYGSGASVTREVFPCYLDSLDWVFDLPVYFVNGVTDLPYIDLYDWIDVMTTINKEAYGDEGYTIALETDGNTALFTRDNQYSMLVDFSKGTILFEDYDAFVHKSSESSLLDLVGIDMHTDDGTDILVKRNLKGSYDRYGKEVELNLTDYDIPIYWSEESRLYLIPLQTLGDFLLSGPSMLNPFFNEEAVYLTKTESMTDGDELSDLGISYYSAPCSDMSEELAWFNYCELCLALDHLYGLKELHGIDSFDQMFSETGYKEDLQSTDPQIAENALNEFIEYYLDDLHSGMIGSSYRVEEADSEVVYGLSYLQSGVDAEIFSNARENAEYEIYAYEEVGNTAYVTFDSFDLLLPAYDYYLEEYEVPELPSDVPMDTIALILYAHEQITREDSPIENVVIDLSNNTGGAVDAACMVASWFLGKAAISVKSTFTGAMSTDVYQVDTNLDGEYDEDDTVADKNLFCLISPVSFSCGNMVPSIFKSSHKVTILGQTSGGGGCILLSLSTASGSCIQTSSPLNMSYVKNGSYYAIDAGVEPDLFIAKPEHFYDREALTEYLNNMF